MPATPTTQEMGERHEKHVAEALGGTKTRGSGNGVDKGDGAHHHDDPFAFRWDAKSTKGKQIALTLGMIDKICEQAGGERPAIPLRWYGNEMLTTVLHDWIAVQLTDFSELLAAAQDGEEAVRAARSLAGELEAARNELAPLRARLAASEERLAEREIQQRQQAPQPNGAPVPGYVPQLPWTIVHQVHVNGDPKLSGLYFDSRGHQSPVVVTSVRVERSLGSGNRPRLIVNDTRVPQGALYVDGHLSTQVCAGNPAIERG